MPRLRSYDSKALGEIAAGQAGAVSRQQALTCRMTSAQIDRKVSSNEWQKTEVEGVYLIFSGPPGDLTRCWVALLYAGPGAALCRESAAWAWGLRDDLPTPIDVVVPVSRRVACQRKIAIHYTVHLAARRHPARTPPTTRLEDTVLDIIDTSQRGAEVIDVLTRACQRRLTTAALLVGCAASRKKLRRRALVDDVLVDVAVGVQSPLERAYFRDVERPHGLPRGRRNRPEGVVGLRRYRDVRYDDYALVVELDGRAAHPDEARSRDDIRDNELLDTEDVRTLRYGWTPVVESPCETAGQIGRVLMRGGWTGGVRSCGPGCCAASASPAA